MGSMPRPVRQPTATHCALGGHPGLSHLRLISVSHQQRQVLAMGVIWDGRACSTQFACSDSQFLHCCDPCQAAYCHVQACSWGAQWGWMHPEVLSHAVQHGGALLRFYLKHCSLQQESTYGQCLHCKVSKSSLNNLF